MQSGLFVDGLEVADAEIVFSFLSSIKNEDLPVDAAFDLNVLKDEVQQLALQLFLAYRDGEGVVADERIAEAYLALYLSCPTSSESFFDDVLFWLSWFTTLRLSILLRGDRELALLPFTSLHDHPIQFNKALQFSYGLEIIVGIVKLLYYSFRPELKEDYDSSLPWYKRFSRERYYNIRNSSQFTNFMSNAIAWFVINGLSLLCVAVLGTLTISYLVQLAGFAYDIYHDYVYAAEERDKHAEAYSLVQTKVNPTQTAIRDILLNKIRNKFNASSEKVSRVVKIASFIFIGMVLLYFLPLLSHYIAAHLVLFGVANLLLSYDVGKSFLEVITEVLKTIGSTIVVVAGVVYGGLCGRLWRLESWKKSALWLLDFAVSNLPEFMIASVIFLSGGLAAIPLIGAAIVGLGTPVAFSLTFIAVRGIVKLGEYLWQQLRPPHAPLLSGEELTQLKEVLLNITDTFSEIVPVEMLQGALSADNQLLLKKASGLNDNEWLRHIRNWSLSPQKRERSLTYQSLELFCDQLRTKFTPEELTPTEPLLASMPETLSSLTPELLVRENAPSEVPLALTLKNSDPNTPELLVEDNAPTVPDPMSSNTSEVPSALILGNSDPNTLGGKPSPTPQSSRRFSVPLIMRILDKKQGPQANVITQETLFCYPSPLKKKAEKSLADNKSRSRSKSFDLPRSSSFTLLA